MDLAAACITTVAATTPAPVLCDGALLNGKCFQYYSTGTGTDQPTAQANCVAWGGTLAIIDSQQESNLAILLKETAGDFYAWIGLMWIRNTGVWQWVDGTVYPLDVNNKDVWAWGCADAAGCQPDFDPTGTDNCVHYWDRTWNELGCTWIGAPGGLGHVCTKAAAACEPALHGSPSASFPGAVFCCPACKTGPNCTETDPGQPVKPVELSIAH